MAAEESLVTELSDLKEEVSQIAQELLSHRKVLEQLLEVREGCMELLEHRETFAQCLDLREGMQVVLSSARIISEVGDKTTELELSLAGVSDNTARHGRAISTLTEHSKRTQATLDAVVRAVKRLDRSRSRCRDATPSSSHGAPLSARAFGLSRPGGDADPAHDVPMEEWGVSAPELARGEAEDAWTGAGWGAVDERPPVNEDEPRAIGGAVSSGSSGEIRRGSRQRAASGRPRRPPSRAGHRGSDVDDSAGERPAAVTSTTPRSTGDPGAGGGSEMAHCVKGVLARIEEALTKLDGTNGQEPTLSARALNAMVVTGPAGGQRAPAGLPTARPTDPWADPGSARGTGGYARRQRTPSRPQSASARRGSSAKGGAGAGGPGIPAYYSSSTPRRRQDGDWAQDHGVTNGHWRAADSWA